MAKPAHHRPLVVPGRLAHLTDGVPNNAAEEDEKQECPRLRRVILEGLENQKCGGENEKQSDKNLWIQR